jgi:hypothetical protein
MGKPVVGVVVAVDGLKQLKPLLALTNPRLYDKAKSMAVKAATKTGTAAIAKGIAQRYTITSGRIKKDISKPYFSGGNATVLASRLPPTFNQYRFKPGTRGGKQPGLGRGMGWGKPSRPGRPATAQVFKGTPARPIKGAFMAKGLPMIRIKKERGPKSLKVLVGPSIARIFAGRGVFARALQQDTGKAIDGAFTKTVDKVMRDAARGYGRP